jgi:hypothetical protein
MKFRKLLRILHRDFGYFIVAMTLVYSLSGILLNHRHDFNPDYKIIITDFKTELPINGNWSESFIKDQMKAINEDVVFKKHYINNDGQIKIFVENGEAIINPDNGNGTMQYLEKRPLIFGMNRLHRASMGTLWKWTSDLMGVILIFVAVSGMFILKGKRGLTKWGWWFVAAGVIVPVLFALIYI